MSKFIQRVTVIQQVDGERVAHDLITPGKKSKRGKKRPRWARAGGKSERGMLNAQATFWTELLGRHDRSNKKKAWGSVRDGPKNAAKALRKALKKLR
jgi:hypothetical protein